MVLKQSAIIKNVTNLSTIDNQVIAEGDMATMIAYTGHPHHFAIGHNRITRIDCSRQGRPPFLTQLRTTEDC